MLACVELSIKNRMQKLMMPEHSSYNIDEVDAPQEQWEMRASYSYFHNDLLATDER